MSEAAFRARVREALATPLDGRLTERFPAPLVTAIIAGAGPEEVGTLELALLELIHALSAVGVPRGRQFVLLGTLSPAPASEIAARLRATLGVPVLVHDPLDANFVAGVSSRGEPFELSSELREAEAVVVVGPARAGEDGRRGGVGLLCPGVVSSRTCAAWTAANERDAETGVAFALEVERALTADLALLWDASGQVTAGTGRSRFTALASVRREA